MKTTTATLAAALLATADAQKFVQWDIERRVEGHNDINRRQNVYRRANGAVEEPLQNNVNAYFASVAIGNPGQKFDLQLDTGSSDIWVPSASSATCRSKNPGCPGGSYNARASSTYKNLGSDTFEISYADQSGASGDYIQEDFTISGTLVKNMTMGMATVTKQVEYGLIGVGYMRNEASTQTIRKIYPNLPVALQQQDKTNSVAYSLWLNDKTASKGNILFGAVDTEKFEGDLAIMDILIDQRINNYTHFSVPLTSVTAESSTGSDVLNTNINMPITAVLDSGTSLTYLPDDMAQQAWKEAGAIYDNSPDFGIALIPCEFANNNNAGFTFGFGGPNGPKIKVPIRDMIVPAFKRGSRPFTSGQYKGKSICTFGIQNQTATKELPVFLLGDTMLRSAYVVYDLVNNQIGIAPAKVNSTKSNIVTFKANGSPIPNGKTISGGAKKEAPAPSNPFKAQAGFTSSSSGGGGSSGSGNSNNKNAAVTSSYVSGTALMVVLGSLTYALAL